MGKIQLSKKIDEKEKRIQVIEKVQELTVKADFDHLPESLDGMVDNLSKEK